MTKEERLSQIFGEEMTGEECFELAEALDQTAKEIKGLQQLGRILFPNTETIKEEHRRAVEFLDTLNPVHPTGHSVQEEFKHSHAFKDGCVKYDQMYVELKGKDVHCHIGTREVLLALSVLIRTNELQELPEEIAKHYAELCNVPTEWFCKNCNEDDDWEFLK